MNFHNESQASSKTTPFLKECVRVKCFVGSYLHPFGCQAVGPKLRGGGGVDMRTFDYETDLVFGRLRY